MPPLKPRRAEELEAEHQEFREQLAAREPWLANLEAATTQHDDGELRFRGRRYRIPPVPYRNGLQIHVLDRLVAWCFRELGKLEKEGKTALDDALGRWLAEQLAKSYEALAGEYWAVVKPVGLWHRLTWRWRGNPFLDATEQEIKELAQLFLAARTICRVRAVTSIWAPPYLRMTSTTSGMPSPLAIPPSLRRKVGRAVGGTMPGDARVWRGNVPAKPSASSASPPRADFQGTSSGPGLTSTNELPA